MFQTTRADLGADNISEDEEASLVKERDRTLRTALDQIQQRRRAPPPNPPNLPSIVGVVEHQFKDCGDGGDAVEATVDSETATPMKPSPSQDPLVALRQREWLRNLQEQQELQSLKVASFSPLKQDLTLKEKEEQLLFNGEVPPLLPVQSSAPATCTTTTVSSTSSTSTPCSITTSSHSKCTTTSSTMGSMNSMRARASRASSGSRGRGSSRSRPPSVHHNSRGGPLHRRGQHGGRWGQERRAKEISMPQGRENTTPKGREDATPQGRENATPQGREKPVQQTGQASNERGHANSPQKTTELASWQKKATPVSVEDEAAMLAQAIELSHLDSAADSKLEEEQLRIVLEQSRQETQRRIGGGGNHRRGASRSGRRGWGGPGRGGGTAESCPQASPPPHLAGPPNRRNGFTIVGSIDAGPLTSGAKLSPPSLHQVPPHPLKPPLLPPPPPPHQPLPSPPSSTSAEPAVSFDQWLSLCSRYMPLLAQSMVELQRTCATMRSVAPSLEGPPLLLPPPLWSPHFPPPAAQSPLSTMTPPPPLNPPVNPPLKSPMTSSMTSSMGLPPSIGPSHVAPLEGGLLSAVAASTVQCLTPPVRTPRPVRGAGHSAGLQQKNLQHDHQQMPAAHFDDKRQQHSNEQIHVGEQASGDAGHRLHHKNAQHHPHQPPPPAAANAGRKQPHTELVQGAKQSSDDAGRRQHQKPAQQQPPATNTVNKLHTSEQPHAPSRGKARMKKRKGGKPTCS